MDIIRPFHCKRDNLTIRGTLFISSEKPVLPIAIVSHEFMANQLFSFAYAKTISKLGYAVFCYDFCGGGIVNISGGKSQDMSVITEIKDLKAVINYAKSLKFTDENEIVLMGCSQGGFVSALTAAQLKDEISALILQYPALSIPDDARRGEMIKAKFNPNNIPDTLYCSVMKLGKQYVSDVLEMDPYKIIGEYKGDVLIIHGNADNLVDISYSERAINVYCKSGAKAQLKVIDKAGHIFTNPKHIKQAEQYITEFLTERNGSGNE